VIVERVEGLASERDLAPARAGLDRAHDRVAGVERKVLCDLDRAALQIEPPAPERAELPDSQTARACQEHEGSVSRMDGLGNRHDLTNREPPHLVGFRSLRS